MQITETISEPLHREFTVVVGATDLDAKLSGKLAEMQPKIHLKGFRPGKAPVSFLKKTYGKSLMGEIVNETINESSEQLLKDKEIKPATAPRVDLVNPLDNVIAGKADLEFTMKVDDPKAYVSPWMLVKMKVLKLNPKYEIQEAICAPSDEKNFNKDITIPADTIGTAK